MFRKAVKPRTNNIAPRFVCLGPVPCRVTRVVESDSIPEPAVGCQGSRRLGSGEGERCHHDAGRKSARELRAACCSTETQVPVELTRAENGRVGDPRWYVSGAAGQREDLLAPVSQRGLATASFSTTVASR